VKLARVILADELPLPEGAGLNVGVTLTGGVYYGVYPGEAECGVDVRDVPGMTLAALQADVETFLEALRREDQELQVAAAWHPVLTWYPPSAIDPGHPLVASAAEAARTVLGREVPLGIMPAFTDATNWSEAGMPSIPASGQGC
jgi:succinyl-diaminopimelate desuccinylase